MTQEQNPELGIRANLAEMQRLLNETQKLLESSRGECLQPSPLANTLERETKTPEQIEQSRMQMKQALALAFWKSVKQQRLTQKAAGRLVGMSQQKVSDLMLQNVAGLSERKIIECLTSIGCDIEITVRQGTGQIVVTS